MRLCCVCGEEIPAEGATKYCRKAGCQEVREKKRKSKKKYYGVKKPSMMFKKVEVRCLNCDELFMSQTKYFRTCPKCKKLLDDSMEWPY